MFRKLALCVWHLPRQLAVAGITLYQCTLSPDHGFLRHLYPFGYCRHEPTCSQYAKRQLLQEGVIRGLRRLLRRLLSCHPWAPLSEEKVKKAIRL